MAMCESVGNIVPDLPGGNDRANGVKGMGLPPVIERNMDRADLPLVVIPACIRSLVPLFAERLPMFDGLARVRMHTDLVHDVDMLVDRMRGATVVMSSSVHFSPAMLAAIAQSVRCITFGGTGVASFVDLPQARRLGIRVCNAVHYGDNAVAEHAIALMFELTHKAGLLHARMNGTGPDADPWPSADIEELSGRALGLIGFGGIGHRVAQLARGLGLDLLVWARRPDSSALRQLGARQAADIDEVFESSDIVSVHLSLNEGTRGMITGRHLDLLHSGAMLVNTARAELIEPGALLRRLRRGDVRAGIDVFEPEPLPADDPLRTLPNVVLTPHVAWRSGRALAGIADQNMRSAVAFLNGGSYNVVE